MPYPEATRKEQRRAYYVAHCGEIKARSAAWRAANPEAVAAYRVAHQVKATEYCAANKDRIKARQEAYYVANPSAREVKRTYNAAYRAAHPDQYRNHCTRRRAQILGADVCDLTPSEWKAIKELYRFRCVYCGERPKRLTQDHIIPLSRGGNHTLANVVPACHSCNSRKWASPPKVPVQPALLV